MMLLKNFLNHFLQRYEENLQNKMKGSEFGFNGVNLL